MNIRDTEMTASIIEASMELLGAIVKFYTACLVSFRQCFLGNFTITKVELTSGQ
jgi:hypothetical protein